MDKFYFRISGSKGAFYQSSKEPKDGYEKIEYNGGITYHKYQKTLTGVLVSLGKKDISTKDGKTIPMFEVILRDGDIEHVISTNLKSANGKRYSREVEMLLGALRNYNTGETITISPVIKKYTGKDGVERDSLNIYINYTNIMGDNQRPMSLGFIPFSEIPGPEVEEVAGDKVYTYKACMEFYYKILTDLSAKFPVRVYTPRENPPAQQAPAANTTAAATAPKQPVAASAPPVADDDDDDSLPF